MNIIKATPEHMDAILNIIEAARTIMRETGNMTQWTNGYPSREVILNDIEAGQAFVFITDQEIAGYFCLITGNDPDRNYQLIEQGKWLNDKPYGVIHRLASGRKVKGIAQMAFDYAFSHINNVKVDTHHDNIPMKNFLQKNGFAYCGIIYVSDGTPRDAFQKQQ